MTAQSRMGRQKEDTPIVNYQISGDCAAGELVHLVGCPGSGVLRQCAYMARHAVLRDYNHASAGRVRRQRCRS